MATFSGNISTNLKLYLEITQVSQDINNNTSQVRARGYISGTGNGAWNAMSTSGTLTLNGVAYPFTVSSYDFSGSVSLVLKDVTATIAHNSDGTKTVSASVYWNPDNPEWLDAKTVSGSLTLTTIPRASKFTASDINAGLDIPISLTKSPAATTHKVTVNYGNTVVVNNKDIGANPTSIPLTTAEWDIFYNLTKTVTSGSLVITLTTYNGPTALGTDSKTITVTYASTDVPSFTSLTATETNTTVSSVIDVYLQLLSKIKFTINGAAGIKGSTISAYEIKFDTAVYAVNNPIHTANNAGTFTASGRVQDSRGRWSSAKTLSVTILPYSYPSITLFKVDRATSAGVVDLLGTYAKTQLSGKVASVMVGGVQKNSIRYRVDDVTSGTVNKVGIQTILNTTASNVVHTFGTYPIDTVAILKMTLTDAFNQSVQYNISLSTADVPFTLGKYGVAIGGVVNNSLAEVLQVYKKARFFDDVSINGVATFNSVPNFNAGTPVVEIPANADLNSYTTPGEYFCPSNAATQTIANTPSDWAFFLKVGRHAGVYQEFTEHHGTGAKKYFRNTSYDGTWGPWYEIVYPVAKSGDINNGYIIYSNGRMEQWKTISYTNLPITTALGTNSWQSGGIALGTWLTPFTTVNSTILYKMRTNSVGVYANFSGTGVSDVGSVYFIMNGRSETVSSLTITVMAEGTW